MPMVPATNASNTAPKMGRYIWQLWHLCMPVHAPVTLGSVPHQFSPLIVGKHSHEPFAVKGCQGNPKGLNCSDESRVVVQDVGVLPGLAKLRAPTASAYQ